MTIPTLFFLSLFIYLFINPLLPRHRLRQNIFTKIKILACYRLNMKIQKNFFHIILGKAENDTPCKNAWKVARTFSLILKSQQFFLF